MKVLVVYATKHGAAGEIARRIGKRMGAAAYDLKQGGVPPVDGYDCVIVGSSVYAGQLRKEAKAFVAQNAGALRRVKLGLFVSGMAPGGEEDYLNNNYPKDVVDHAAAKAMLGGIADPKKESLLERLVMLLVTRKRAYHSTVSDERIGAFAAKMRA